MQSAGSGVGPLPRTEGSVMALNIRNIRCEKCGAAAGDACTGKMGRYSRSRERRSWHLLRAQRLRSLMQASAYDGRTIRERIAEYNSGEGASA
jgi:hypothetical protein